MYAVKQDILNDFKSLTISSTGTVITDSKLNDIIEQESDFIDSYLTTRYVVPVCEYDYPKAFNVLKRICIFRVSLRVKNIIEVKSDATQQNSEEKFAGNMARTPNDDLMDIVSGKMILIDVPTKNANLGVSSFTSKLSGTCSKFDVNKQQW